MKHYTNTALRMAEDVETEAPPASKFVERGVSVDQDGKSNVWAIGTWWEKLLYACLLVPCLSLRSFLPTIVYQTTDIWHSFFAMYILEPKMEVSTKSSEEQTTSALIAGGGIAAAAVAAGLILTNLPDPNQF